MTVARRTLRDLLKAHLVRYREDLEYVRSVYPERLWAWQAERATRERMEWLLEDILAHFRAYAAEQSAVAKGSHGKLFGELDAKEDEAA